LRIRPEVFIVRISGLEEGNGGVTCSGDLSFMLPLMSKMTPRLIGTSSAEKYAIFCSTLSSQIWK
jgi:hypothetical protein